MPYIYHLCGCQYRICAWGSAAVLLLAGSLLLTPAAIADETTLHKGCTTHTLESGTPNLSCSHRTTTYTTIINFILHREQDKLSISAYIYPWKGYWVSTMPFDAFDIQVDDHPLRSFIGRWSVNSQISGSLLATYPIQEEKAKTLALLDTMAQGEKIAIFIADRHVMIPLAGATTAITDFRERLANY